MANFNYAGLHPGKRLGEPEIRIIVSQNVIDKEGNVKLVLSEKPISFTEWHLSLVPGYLAEQTITAALTEVLDAAEKERTLSWQPRPPVFPP